MSRKITKLQQFGEAPKETEDRKIRCGVYVRVSTATELQDGSYQEQQEYYRNRITQDPELELVHIYADKGSGRSTEHRPEFMRMMEDARKGKFDIIFCKSVSRFGRNIADFTEAARELKKLGIRVVFEKEGLDTSDPQTEIILNIFAVLAQEESNSQSSNAKWSNEKRLQNGIVTVRPTYGYKRGEGHSWVVDEQAAKRVKKAFAMALAGHTYPEITETLNQMEKEDPTGKFWKNGSVKSLLTNPSVTGDYLSGRYILIKDPETGKKKTVKNDGTKAQYLLTNHHAALVSHEDFNKVQDMIERRLLCARASA
jgi:site-specific DNA recombinase